MIRSIPGRRTGIKKKSKEMVEELPMVASVDN
jgi:hypothetical protein